MAGFVDDAADNADDGYGHVDNLFLVPSKTAGPTEEVPVDRLAVHEERELEATLAGVEDEGRRWLDEETEKLDAYSDDLERAAELRIKELDYRESGQEGCAREYGPCLS